MAPSKAAKDAYAQLRERRNKRLSQDTTASLLEKASARVTDASSKSSLFNESKELILPRFESNDLTTGTLLGQGGFCCVCEIQSITEEDSGKLKSTAITELHTRNFMSKYCLRDGQARYAIKQLSNETLASEDLFLKGTADLAIEAKFLAILNHAHVIKLRGLANSGYFSGANFLIIDRLYSTLNQDIVKWKIQEQKYTSCCPMLGGGNDKIRDMVENRLNIAFDIASAFAYLHSMRIIYRDIKPDNIGFDVRGNTKVFDFGLAKEVVMSEKDDDGNYNLTGYTGSPIYMAPEVARMKPYNLSADVYSFGILLWHIMSLESPFKTYNLAVLNKLVHEKGYRPECSESWPVGLKNIMKTCWSSDSSIRPNFEKVKSKLFDLTTESKQDDSGLDISKRSFHGINAMKL